jgi:hypothetical protein
LVFVGQLVQAPIKSNVTAMVGGAAAQGGAMQGGGNLGSKINFLN